MFLAQPDSLIVTREFAGRNGLKTGAKLSFDEVLLGSDGTSVRAGTPMIPGAKVTAEVLRHGKEKKIIVFKMKRRKGYARKQGHRQGFTEIKIDSVELG